MATQADIAASIKSALAVSEPDLDTTMGTVVAKIIDAVANQIADVYIDNHLLTYTYDVDSKTGADLDEFVRLFGISRNPSTRSTGTITLTRAGLDLDSIAFIPVGTQFTSNTENAITFQAIQAGVLGANVPSIVLPIQAVDPGPGGNLGPGQIDNVSTPVQGVTSVVNLGATSGGIDQETDTELRARWKATVFRNMAGTEPMYLGIALADADCFAANVVTATKMMREQVQITAGTATSTLTDSKYVFNTPVSLGRDLENGDVFTERADYTFTATNPPVVTAVSATALPNDTIADLMFQYTPECSRNDPANGIIHRVDVYCGGTRAVPASQVAVFNNLIRFTSPAGTYPIANFQRFDGTQPVSNNVFVPLAFGPIVSIAPTITIGGTTYAEATVDKPMGTVADGMTYAYRVVHDITANGLTPSSLFGLEWHAASLPANGSILNIGADGGYTYNQVPLSVQQSINSWRLAGIDARAHQAKARLLRFSLAVMYDRGAFPATVNQMMDSALSEWLNGLGLNANVQVSDVLQVLHNVPGVDNVRFLNTSDDSEANGIAIQTMSSVGTLLTTHTDGNGRAKDIFFKDDELPQFGGSRYIQKAANSFGTY